MKSLYYCVFFGFLSILSVTRGSDIPYYDTISLNSYITVKNVAMNETYTGYSISDLGDVNGDGKMDIGIKSNCAFYIVYGTSSFDSIDLPKIGITTTTGWTIKGTILEKNCVLSSIVGIGDFNGDGTDDILIGLATSGSVSIAPYYYLFLGTSDHENVRLDYYNDFWDAQHGPYFRKIVGPWIDDSTPIPTDDPTSTPSSKPSAYRIQIPGDPSSAPSASPTNPSSTPTSSPSSKCAEGHIDSRTYVETSTAFYQSLYLGMAGLGDINGDSLADFLIQGSLSEETQIVTFYVIFGTSDLSGDNAIFSLERLSLSEGFKIDSSLSLFPYYLTYTETLLSNISNDCRWNEDNRYYNLYSELKYSNVTNYHYALSVNTHQGGDVNGDGWQYSDLIFGSPYANNFAGQVIVVWGRQPNDIWTSPYDLTIIPNNPTSTLYGILINGINEKTETELGDHCGFSVASHFDYNDDTIEDILIGCPYANSQAGIAYVVLGSTDQRETIVKLRDLTTENGFSISTTGISHLGWSVSPAGDFNGNGVDDIVIGIPMANDGAGEVIVIYGSDRSLYDMDVPKLTSSEAKLIFGSSSSSSINHPSKTGYLVSGGGNRNVDFNGDSYKDILISSPFDTSSVATGQPVFNVGTSYIVYGSLIKTQHLYLDSLSIVSSFGTSTTSPVIVHIAGDINKDGYIDFLLSSYKDASTYLFLGRSNGLTSISDLSLISNFDDFAFSIRSDDTTSSFGFSLTSIGDFNGDGYDDFAIGSPGSLSIGDYGPERISTGYFYNTLPECSVYVFYGGNSITNHSVLTNSMNNVPGVFIQGLASSGTGYSIAGVGNVRNQFNAEGSESPSGNLVIGAPFANDTRGTVYILYGSSDYGGMTSSHEIDFSSQEGDLLVISGAFAFEYTGYAVASAGDINGDGFQDILFSAPTASYFNATETGRGLQLQSFERNNENTHRQQHLNGTHNTFQRKDGIDIQDAATGVWHREVGVIYLLLGGTYLQSTRYIDLVYNQSREFSSYGITIYGSVSYGQAGMALAGLGDIDGDGYADFGIGCPMCTVDCIDCYGRQGTAYILYGGTDLPSTIYLAHVESGSSSLGYSLTGDTSLQFFGYSIAGAGDINNDGFPDIAIGSPGSNNDAGLIYIIYGGKSRTSFDLSSFSSEKGVIITASISSSQIGWSVSSYTDKNGEVLTLFGDNLSSYGAKGTAYAISPQGYAGNSTISPSARPTSRPSGLPSSCPSGLPSVEPSGAPSAMPTNPTSVPSGEPSVTPSGIPSASPSVEPSGIPSGSPSALPSGIPSGFPSGKPSGVPSAVPTNPTSAPSGEPSVTPSGTPSGSPSVVPSGIPSGFPSTEPSGVPSAMPTNPTSAPSGSPSGSPSVVPSSVPSAIPTNPTSAPSGRPSACPSASPSGGPSVAPSGIPSAMPTNPTSAPSGEPSGTPSGIPSGSPSSGPSGIPSGFPSTAPSGIPSALPTSPTSVPSGEPSGVPSGIPSGSPSVEPSGSPSGFPSTEPSGIPSALPTSPTSVPSGEPSGVPSGIPSGSPSALPSGIPSEFPSTAPSGVPSAIPTNPTSCPSGEPSVTPSGIPSGSPSSGPSGIPSGFPSTEPSGIPSALPTSPTSAPSGEPSGVPSGIPSGSPSVEPSGSPSGFPSTEPSGIPSALPTSPTSVPSGEPSGVPSGIPSGSPSALPSGIPSEFPSTAPSGVPSAIPTNPTSCPSGEPSVTPSGIPSGSPSSGPSGIPSGFPSTEPSGIPSALPTSPTSAPSGEPSGVPSGIPSGSPSVEPSGIPSGSPSSLPSGSPSGFPSTAPSGVPSLLPVSPTSAPSGEPSGAPSGFPSGSPSVEPTGLPSSIPSLGPSSEPTVNPSSIPSRVPVPVPSTEPSGLPSSFPSVTPTCVPSSNPSSTPTLIPSSLPTAVPRTLPTSIPSEVPSLLPSSDPSTKPLSVPSGIPISESSSFPTSLPSAQITSSPTLVGFSLLSGSATSYIPKSSFSFSAVNPLTGEGHIWGIGSTSPLSKDPILKNLKHISLIRSCTNAYSIVHSNGSLYSWGAELSTKGWTNYRNEIMKSISSTEYAFAGITIAGKVIAFGSSGHGGIVPAVYASYLTDHVIGVVGSSSSFCAWKTDGTVYCWGNSNLGGGKSTIDDINLQNIASIYANRGAFVARKFDSSIVTWGDCNYGGCLQTAILAGIPVQTIIPTKTAFLAITLDNQVIVWGNQRFGGLLPDSVASKIVTEIVAVAYTSFAIGILQANGKLLTWGDSRYGGKCDSLINSVLNGRFVELVGNDRAFVVRTKEGKVGVCGASSYGGNIDSNQALQLSLSADIIKVVASQGSFAAVTETGNVITWGLNEFGGNSVAVQSYIQGTVKRLLGIDAGFVAINSKNQVIGWGTSLTFPNPGIIETLSGSYEDLQFS
jgi:alpha-tubulin suppressor-like RCC1 family protein